MGEVVLRTFAREVGWEVEVTSAGTANWNVGQLMDPRAQNALRRAGFEDAGSPARFASAEYLERQDVVIVMTSEHRVDVVSRRGGSDNAVLLVRTLAGERHDLDLADPYYGDDHDFDSCLDVIIRACRELVQAHRPEDAPSAM